MEASCTRLLCRSSPLDVTLRDPTATAGIRIKERALAHGPLCRGHCRHRMSRKESLCVSSNTTPRFLPPVSCPSARLGGRFGRRNRKTRSTGCSGAALSAIADQPRADSSPSSLRGQGQFVRPGGAARRYRDAISVEIVDGSLSIQASRKDKSGDAENTVSFNRLVSIPRTTCRRTRSLPRTRTESSP